MSKLKTVEYILGGDYSIDTIKILQKYFRVNWKFAKQNFIYYIDPESNETMCQPLFITFDQSNNYKFKRITLNTIKEYVDRLQEQETDLARRDGQPTSGIQCTTSKATIASGHLEYGKIDFRRRSKAKIGKANLSF
jgi:hypothetical protein